MTRPLRSTPITEASPLLRTGPPAGPATVLTPREIPELLPVSHRQPGGKYRTRPSPVPCKSRRPDSRRLHAGHRLASKQASARLIPESFTHPGFDAIFLAFDTSAAIRLRSPSRSPPDTVNRCLFRIAHHDHVTGHAACGGLKPPPAGRLRRASNPSSSAQHCLRSSAYIENSFLIRDTRKVRVETYLCAISTRLTDLLIRT
jgi:hypothetical protein